MQRGLSWQSVCSSLTINIYMAITIMTNVISVVVIAAVIIMWSRVFDDDKSGTMDFGEFVLATNCTSLSDPQAKVR